MKSAHIAILLDRSGSMDEIRESAEEGVNSFIGSQKSVPGTCTVGIAQFDDQFEIVTEPVPLAEITPISIVPRNATALLDAMGSYITSTSTYIDSLASKPDQIYFVIVTDGKENYSREWTYSAVAKLVRSHPDWHFAFIAANMDAIAEATKLGIRADSAMGYSHTGRGVSAAYGAATASVLKSRSGGTWNLPEKAE